MTSPNSASRTSSPMTSADTSNCSRATQVRLEGPFCSGGRGESTFLPQAGGAERVTPSLHWVEREEALCKTDFDFSFSF